MAAPRVSVVCIFYNEESYLAEAVDSVLAQDFPDFELLLVDDGSSDRSTAIARDYAASFPEKIRYLEHPGHANRGMSAARNLGFRHARGDLIACMDGDDRWRPNRLREQVAILDAHPDVGLVCGTANYWASWAGGTDRLVRTGHLVDGASYPPETSLKVAPLGRTEAPCDVLVRRELVERVGGCEEEFGGLYEDIVFHAKLYLEAGVYLSSQVWFDYRLHPESCCASATPEELRQARMRFLEWFERYLRSRGKAQEAPVLRAVRRALRREQFRARNPKAARLGGQAKWLVKQLLRPA